MSWWSTFAIRRSASTAVTSPGRSTFRGSPWSSPRTRRAPFTTPVCTRGAASSCTAPSGWEARWRPRASSRWATRRPRTSRAATRRGSPPVSGSSTRRPPAAVSWGEATRHEGGRSRTRARGVSLTLARLDRQLVRLREWVLGDVVTPGDEAYEAARRVWNASIDRHPRLIVQCRTVGDVLAAVEFARLTDLPAAVRGGGHHIAGFSTCDDGMVIDLSPMKDVSVDPRARRARVQGGVVWGELDRATQDFGLAVTGGLVSSTGIAGFTLGGGLGWLMRKHGLTCDRLVAADVVTPGAEVVRASVAENADLLWGLRGGGGNFGIVTSFEYELQEVGPDLVGGYRFYPGERAGDVIRLFRELSREAPDELQLGLVLRLAPPAPFLPEAVHGRPVAAIGACYAGAMEDAWQALTPLDGLGAPLRRLLRVAPS